MIRKKYMNICLCVVLVLSLLSSGFICVFAAENNLNNSQIEDIEEDQITTNNPEKAEMISDDPEGSGVLLPGDYEVPAERNKDRDSYINEEGKNFNNMPLRTYITVDYKIKGSGNVKKVVPGTWTLKPVDPDSPMPLNTINAEKTVKVTKAGKFDFGRMTIKEPNVYEYIITRKTTKQDHVDKDTTTYRIKLAALNSGECHVMAYKGKSTKKVALEYVDEMRILPKTGDIKIDPIIIGMFICASIAFIMFVIARRRAKKQM